jgi:hypothetical protein
MICQESNPVSVKEDPETGQEHVVDQRIGSE